tara:strand:+ start:1101 stop:1499 length:399 start_codon:yes stop_codon:yes gene_type:complete
VRLIPDFAQLLHEVKLPSPEKCFLIESGDEKYIGSWVKNGEITCQLDELFDWINKEYKVKNTNLTQEEKILADEIRRRFPIDKWRVIKLFCDHQKKYRYYKKAVEDIKSRTSPRMNEQAIMTVFSPGWGINT